MERQPSAPQRSTEPAAAAAEGVVAAEAQESAAPAASTAEGAAAVEAQEEAPAEAGLVDTASILSAPTVNVVRSSLYVLDLPE
jgi:activator of HSP90 ATPase